MIEKLINVNHRNHKWSFILLLFWLSSHNHHHHLHSIVCVMKWIDNEMKNFSINELDLDKTFILKFLIIAASFIYWWWSETNYDFRRNFQSFLFEGWINITSSSSFLSIKYVETHDLIYFFFFFKFSFFYILQHGNIFFFLTI